MKKQRRNGFTLIELLAVIIILAVIALIATPIVLNVVENAKKKAFERSAQGYYDAARYVHNDMMLNNEEKETKFTFEDGVQKSDNPNYILEVQGETPKSGTVHLSKDGQILVAIANDKWCATINGNGTVDIFEEPNLCGYVPEECLTYYTVIPTEILDLAIDAYVLMYKEYLNADWNLEWLNEPVQFVIGLDSNNSSCKGMLKIPEEHDGKKVEAIYPNAFDGNKNLLSVTLPKSMKYIGSNAFSDASNLKQVNLNEGLISIEQAAFAGTALTSVNIPSSVKYIGISSFEYIGLSEVNIANGVEVIDFYAFGGNQIKQVTIPESVIMLSGFAENQLTEIEIPLGVIEVFDHAFTDNQLTSLDIPDTVESINYESFSNNKITNLTIGTVLNGIYDDVFANNPLTNLTIREGVTTIKDNMFKDHAIVNLSLPGTLKTIGNHAFYNNKLQTINIPNSVTTIEMEAFSNNQFPNADAITVLGTNPNRFDSIWESIGFPAK